MLDLDTLEKYDPQGMHKIYDKWPEIAEGAYNIDLEQANYVGIDHIVFSGMGGSGAIGDFFSAILSKNNIHVCVIKGYLLPKTVDSKTLVITTSISGNTKETLTVLDSARKSNCKIISFSSGGKMEEYSKKYNITHRKISQHHSPRASFTGFLYSMLKVLDPIIVLNRNDVQDSLKQLRETREEISLSNLNDTNEALNLAKWIRDIPLIYYPWGLQAAAIRFKNSLQENAKLHAFAEDVIEASHNGVVSWERTSSIQPILIRGQDDYYKTQERWEILKDYFTRNKIDYREVYSVKGGILSKMMNLIYVLDFSTIYLAVLSRVDPTTVKSIDFMKSRL